MSVTSSEVGERVLESTLTVLSPFLEGIGTYTCVAENVVDTANSTAEVVVFCESLLKMLEKALYLPPFTLCPCTAHSLSTLALSFRQLCIYLISIFQLHFSSVHTYSIPCQSIQSSVSSLLYPAQPFIRDPPVNLTVNQSSPATFSCTAQGNPVPIISWTGPSTNFTTEDTPGANFTVSSVLTIDSTVRALHEGVYTCSASNGVGPSPSSSATLTVQGTAGDTTHLTTPDVL